MSGDRVDSDASLDSLDFESVGNPKAVDGCTAAGSSGEELGPTVQGGWPGSEEPALRLVIGLARARGHGAFQLEFDSCASLCRPILDFHLVMNSWG